MDEKKLQVETKPIYIRTSGNVFLSSLNRFTYYINNILNYETADTSQ